MLKKPDDFIYMENNLIIDIANVYSDRHVDTITHTYTATHTYINMICLRRKLSVPVIERM